MTFIHGYLLGGLLLVGVPVVLHLIMRQKPRRLQFPAFRFLRQRHLINRRKLRLQHLLLLLLRMGVIAALCLALARPRVAAERVASLFNDERPVAAVLIFDTSPSMEYSAAGRTRLEEAKQRARELLDEMNGGSQIALLDSGDDAALGGAEWMSPALAQTRIDGLRIRPANAALNRQIDRAVRLLEKVGESEEPPPRFLYLFSDRTRASWDARAGPPLHPPPFRGGMKGGAEDIRALFVDVGTEKPKDLAIDKVEIVPPIVPPGERIQIQVTVRATGADFDTELLCQLDSEADAGRPPDKQAIQLAAGQGRVIVFEREAPPRLRGGFAEMAHQITVKHQTSDSLPFNNTSFATFLTRERRKVLTLVADKSTDPVPWKAWQTALKVGEMFEGDIRPVSEADKLDDKALRSYAVVCLFQSVPSAGTWQKLERYVRGGGGLVLVPGGEEMRRRIQQYNDEGTKAGLLPGTLHEIVTNPPDNNKLIRWSNFHVQHAIPAFFEKAIRTADPDFGKEQSWPGVNAFWAVKPIQDTVVLASYADPEHHPALLDRAVGRGHVIQFTTPLDTRELDRNRPWHNYWGLDSSFGLVLEDQVCRYLAGDSTRPELNYFCGQTPRLALPATGETPVLPPTPPYVLDGPGLAVAETNVKANEGDTSLSLPQAAVPGNYAVRDAHKRIVAGCSLNVRPQESELERVPAEDIESVLGKDTLLQVGRTISMTDALAGMRPPPLELLPWLMMAVLLVLTVESVLANRFYRRAAPDAEAVANTGEPGV